MKALVPNQRLPYFSDWTAGRFPYKREPAAVPEGRKAFIASRSGLSPEDIATLHRYGLGEALSTDDVRKDSLRFGPPSAGVVVLDVVSAHYDYDRWVRQVQIAPDGGRSVHYLTYVDVAQDAVLNPLCAEEFENRMEARREPRPSIPPPNAGPSCS